MSTPDSLQIELEFGDELATLRQAAAAEGHSLGFFIRSATREATGVTPKQTVLVPPTPVAGFPFFETEVA